jgi:hypothetical protein
LLNGPKSLIRISRLSTERPPCMSNWLDGLIAAPAAESAAPVVAAGSSTDGEESAGDGPPEPELPEANDYAQADYGGDPELDSAVAQIEEDLRSTFIDMEERTSQYEGAPSKKASPALLSLKSQINNVMQQQRIVSLGFQGVKHFEQEGADAMLFGDVPAWITFERISGYRYRMVRSPRPPPHPSPSLRATLVALHSYHRPPKHLPVPLSQRSSVPRHE